jgi:hypothetical protein
MKYFLKILDDGKMVFQSPPESTTITALALSENGQVTQILFVTI